MWWRWVCTWLCKLSFYYRATLYHKIKTGRKHRHCGIMCSKSNAAVGFCKAPSHHVKIEYFSVVSLLFLWEIPSWLSHNGKNSYVKEVSGFPYRDILLGRRCTRVVFWKAQLLQFFRNCCSLVISSLSEVKCFLQTDLRRKCFTQHRNGTLLSKLWFMRLLLFHEFPVPYQFSYLILWCQAWHREWSFLFQLVLFHFSRSVQLSASPGMWLWC